MKQQIQKTAEEKLSIILEGLKGESTVPEICTRYKKVIIKMEFSINESCEF
ncbi:MAG: hypothetical protein AB1298_01665 [Bacteroidota bacterium]